MGGAFLSQPITEKKINKYQHGKIRVVTCEMQGKCYLIQAGENIWKMHLSFSVSAKISISMQSLMDMEE